MSVRPAKTQISLGPVWSKFSLSAWRNLGSLVTYWAHSEDSDLTRRIPRLIWVFAGRTHYFVGFVISRLISRRPWSWPFCLLPSWLYKVKLCYQSSRHSWPLDTQEMLTKQVVAYVTSTIISWAGSIEPRPEKTCFRCDQGRLKRACATTEAK